MTVLCGVCLQACWKGVAKQTPLTRHKTAEISIEILKSWYNNLTKDLIASKLGQNDSKNLNKTGTSQVGANT